MSPLALAPALRRPTAGRGLLRLVLAMAALRRQRNRLTGLDPHLLRDIGLSPEEARTEAARPAWDVPAHWRG